MKLRDHHGLCRHGRSDQHGGIGYDPEPDGGLCPGGAEINLDVAAGYLSAAMVPLSSMHPQEVRDLLVAALQATGKVRA